MLDQVTDALKAGTLHVGDLEATERFFRFVADVIKHARAELALAGGDSFAQSIKEQVEKGEKIQAIKRYRQSIGCGLKDAVDAVKEICGEVYWKR